VKLYSFFRSSAAYRVRIALNLKGLPYETVPVHLARGGGEQFAPAYRDINPQSLVPALEDRGLVITQSLAIIEYLEELHPAPALLPATAEERSRVRGLALSIACDIHPLNNTRVLSYLTGPMGLSSEARNTWYAHWIALGLSALELQVAGKLQTGKFCHGGEPGLVDCCLVPQLANARRFKCDVAPYPTLTRIEANCQALEAFRRAAPDQQPDAE